MYWGGGWHPPPPGTHLGVPFVVDKISNLKNLRVLDFGGSFIKAFHNFFFNSFFLMVEAVLFGAGPSPSATLCLFLLDFLLDRHLGRDGNLTLQLVRS